MVKRRRIKKEQKERKKRKGHDQLLPRGKLLQTTGNGLSTTRTNE
jgi:hypothetical protein